MPDTTTLPMAEGGRASGKTNWPVMIGVGGAGVLLLVLLISSQKSGTSSGTTAAGTSINAALGTVQEQQLNLMGQLSQAQAAISNQVQTGNDQLNSELSAVNSNVVVSGQQQTAQFGELMNVATNPWAKLFYQNQISAGLNDPYLQEQFWTLANR